MVFCLLLGEKTSLLWLISINMYHGILCVFKTIQFKYLHVKFKVDWNQITVSEEKRADNNVAFVILTQFCVLESIHTFLAPQGSLILEGP